MRTDALVGPVLVGLVLLALPSARADGTVVSITALQATAMTLGAVDDAGAVVVAVGTSDPLGTNPGRLPQLFAWDPATGDIEQWTDWDRGVRPDPWGPAISDDGEWVTVVSTSDPAGSNVEHHEEIFLVRAGGGEVRQLTSLGDPDATIGHFDLAGSASRVVFESDADPHGANGARVGQLFVVDADGGGLAQVTAHASADDVGLLWPAISDDGSRVAYESSDGVVGFSWQVFAILADGTDRRQLTDLPFRSPGRVAIAGNGSTVAFETEPYPLAPPPGGCDGGNQIAIVDWDGGNLHLATGVCLGAAAAGRALSPSLTDDGAYLFYAANEFEVWNVERVPKSGSPSTRLTDVASEPGPRAQCLAARASGSGSRVAFRCGYGEPFGGPNPDLSEELYAMDGDGLGARQLSDSVDGASTLPAIATSARRVAFVSDANPTGEVGYWFPQVHLVDVAGTNLVRLTALAGGPVAGVSIAADASTVVFAHDGDPVGANAEGGFEVFAIESDGTGLRQLTPSRPGRLPADGPHLAANGSRVALQSRADLLGTGLPDTLWRVYTVAPDGAGLARLTDDGLSEEPRPRIDATGTWVVWVADGDVFLDRFDGGSGAGLTTHGGVQRADVAPGGDLVVYAAAADPLGTNPERNHELFLRDVSAGTTTQLTVTSSGRNVAPAFSADGAHVHFWSDATHFGDATEGVLSTWRVRVADGTIERTAGLASCGTSASDPSLDPPAAGTDVVAFEAPGDCVGDNQDGSTEVFVADRAAAARIRPSRDEPTIVTWDVESGPTRYDVVRGDVASLGPDLGPVVCIENDSLDAVSDPDPDAPAPGQAFFYLRRGAQGPAETGSYGETSAGAARVASDGDCPG